MNILLAPDKFKGSLMAEEVALALAKGLASGYPEAQIRLHPMADGGDGSLAVLRAAKPMEVQWVMSEDPLGRPLSASYLTDATAAYIELASTAGLVLLPPSERNPLLTSTRGVGLQIRDAIARGKGEIYLFIGGSATNDGGMGIADALGFRFFDSAGKQLHPKGENLEKIAHIELPAIQSNIAATRFFIVCDVTNPLIGKEGAAAVYAAQKGASAAGISCLGRGLKQLADVLVGQGYPAIHHLPGAGAAGGVGGGLHALLGAVLQPGFSSLAQITKLEEAMDWADCVVSGEGKLDAQTAQGKVVAGVQALAMARGIPLIVVCGTAEEEAAKALGLDTVYTVLSRASSLKDAMENAAPYLIEIGEELGRESSTEQKSY